MAHFIIEFKASTRKKWHLVDKVKTKKEAEENLTQYKKHIRRQDEMDGMQYRLTKVKGNIDE